MYDVSASNVLAIVEQIPAERAATRVAGLEPLIQAARVEEVLACTAFFAWKLLVGANNRVTYGTFCLSFESAKEISAKSDQAVDKIAVLAQTVSTYDLCADITRNRLTEKVITPCVFRSQFCHFLSSTATRLTPSTDTG